MRTPKLHDALLVHRCTPHEPAPGVALVSRVWNDRCVNAGGWTPGGSAAAFSSLLLVHDDEPDPEGVFAFARFASTEANPTVFHVQV